MTEKGKKLEIAKLDLSFINSITYNTSFLLDYNCNIHENKMHSYSDGSRLTLTVAQYKTPKGTIIQGKGIEPDIKDSLPANPYVNAIIGPSRITRFVK